jgi:hypothetical protein
VVDKDKEQCCPSSNACESDGEFYAYCCEGSQVCAIDPEDSSFLSCVNASENCGGRACYSDTGKTCADGKSCCAPATVPCDPSGAVWLCCSTKADCPADVKAKGAACKGAAAGRRLLLDGGEAGEGLAAAGARTIRRPRRGGGVPAWARPQQQQQPHAGARRRIAM